MYERIYRATKFDEALSMVRRELGPDAVIVSSRQLPVLEEFGDKPIVEVKALPEGMAQQAGFSRDAFQARFNTHPIERELKAQGVPATPARNIALHIHRATKGKSTSLQKSFDALSDALRDIVSFSGPLGESSTRAVALVGPTGVGKTTTIAKLAAQAALVEGHRVGLISIDQYRIGGTEQLAQYADLIGIPMKIAHGPVSLSRALKELRSADLVLIDTEGRTPSDKEALLNMSGCLHGASEPIDVHLCLETATREREMQAIIDRSSVLRPRRLNMTKLDEAVTHGSIISAHLSTSLPLSYFTLGQRVPEDIEVASSERLAALLCEREVN